MTALLLSPAWALSLLENPRLNMGLVDFSHLTLAMHEGLKSKLHLVASDACCMQGSDSLTCAT